MRILILSFYFPPDLSAGSFRAKALVQALLDADSELEVDVVTTLPNRYSSFSSEATADEKLPRVTIHRVALPAHRSGMRDQARAFLTFMWRAIDFVHAKRYDLVFGTSSRLMTAALAAHVARRLKAPLYLDIRDIFVDTIKDVLPRRLAKLAEPVFSRIERVVVRRAVNINLVSKGFEPYFMNRYPNQSLTFFSNGVDDEFIEMPKTYREPIEGATLTVLYAGNIGEGQGLHNILPELALGMGTRVRFRVLGDGGRRAALEKAFAASGNSNVTILPPVKRDELLKEYDAADVLFLHLNDHDAFQKVLPSKLFEYAATGKPIWAGIAGYSAQFARSQIKNIAIFAPCQASEAEAAFAGLRIGYTDRSEFIKKYKRSSIMKLMALDVLNYMEN